MATKINLSESNITKLTFIYDNGRPYVAAGIKRVSFNTSDIDNKDCITYSQTDGKVSTVYRDDLAAVTAYYGENAIATQKLMDCAMIDGGAHIKMRQPKGVSPMTAKDKANKRAKKIESSIKRYTARAKRGMKAPLKPMAKAKNKEA